MSWWDLGQGSGYHGTSLALHQITCGFGNERGKWERSHHQEKKKDNKVLNYDIYRCVQCGNYTMVFWAASGRIHDYKTVPWPRQTITFPEHWPSDIGRFWLQAQRSL